MDCNEKDLNDIKAVAIINRERIKHLENELTEIKILLREIKETNIKMKTIIGATTFILGGIWILITSFRELIISWVQK